VDEICAAGGEGNIGWERPVLVIISLKKVELKTKRASVKIKSL